MEKSSLLMDYVCPSNTDQQLLPVGGVVTWSSLQVDGFELLEEEESLRAHAPGHLVKSISGQFEITEI